jgi:hypothetical protein
MGASTDALRLSAAPFSIPAHQNRKCPIKASGFPTGFTADSQTSCQLGSAELQYTQLAKHRFDAETVGPTRWLLVAPPQEMSLTAGVRNEVIRVSLRGGSMLFNVLSWFEMTPLEMRTHAQVHARILSACSLARCLAFGSDIWKNDDALQWTRATWKQQCASSCRL